jgi:hypothetical protein
LRGTRPNDPRWDYGVGLRRDSRDTAIWIEFHPANSLHVDEVIRKREWLRGWLSTRAPKLDRLAAGFKWVATGRVALQKGSPQLRRVAAAGIDFCGSRLLL